MPRAMSGGRSQWVGEWEGGGIFEWNPTDCWKNSRFFTLKIGSKYILERKAVVPLIFTLHQNFPNPFNPITNLRYDLADDSFVTLTIYNMLGTEVIKLVNSNQEAGFRSIQWDATDSMGRAVSAGVYLYQIQAGEFVQTKKMLLLK